MESFRCYRDLWLPFVYHHQHQHQIRQQCQHHDQEEEIQRGSNSSSSKKQSLVGVAPAGQDKDHAKKSITSSGSACRHRMGMVLRPTDM